MDDRSQASLGRSDGTLSSSGMMIILVEPIGAHGGMEHFDQSYCRALAKYDLELIWATCDETEAAATSYEFWTPFRSIYGEAPSWQRGLKYARGWGAILRRARRESRKRAIVIHQHFVTLMPVEWCFVTLARLNGIPCVLTPHDTVPFSVGRWTQRLLPAFYRQYDAIIAQADSSQSELERMGLDEDKIHRIALGSLNDAYGTGRSISRHVARLQLALPDDVPVILFLGRIREGKGLTYLIQAMPLILQKLPDAQLIIAGHPGRSDIATYEKLVDGLGISDKVCTRWEYIPNEQLPLYFRAADAVALPYTRIYQSAVVMTACAFQRPVVATTVGGLKEQVKDGQTGYLVPPRDVRALADALVNLVSDRDRADAMGKVGCDWAALAGDWDRVASQALAVYQKVLCQYV